MYSEGHQDGECTPSSAGMKLGKLPVQNYNVVSSTATDHTQRMASSLRSEGTT